MSARAAAIVDGRGASVGGTPTLPGLPPVEPTPTLLVDERLMPSTDPVANRGGSRRPVAAMPIVDPDSRTETRPIIVYVEIDVSGSNGTTDPQDARFQDHAFFAREWAAEVLPDVLFVLVLFDDEATVYPPCLPHEIPEDGGRSLPNPGVGGTRYAPAARAVVDHASRYPDHAKVAIKYSDGMGGDVAEANRLLSQGGITCVLVPYGPDFPWVSAQWGWNNTAFRIAAHVDDRPHAIAQTSALVLVEIAGMQRVG